MVWIGWAAAKRREAIMASQQQPQQLQMKFTSSRTFSPNCTRLEFLRLVEQVQPLDGVHRARVAVADERAAEVLKVMQMSCGASQARPTCSILWRQ